MALGVPYDFRLEDFPLSRDGQEWLSPGAVLNDFPRAIWPEWTTGAGDLFSSQ